MAQLAQYPRSAGDPFADFHHDTQKRQAGFGIFAALLLLAAVITAFYALGWR